MDFCLVNPVLPHPGHTPFFFDNFLCVLECAANPSFVANSLSHSSLGQKKVFSFWEVSKCFSRDLLEDNFLPQPVLGQVCFCSPVWVFRCCLRVVVFQKTLLQMEQFLFPSFWLGNLKGSPISISRLWLRYRGNWSSNCRHITS